MYKALIFIGMLVLSGCSPSGEDPTRALSPEDVSLGFFNAIYVDRDVNQALPYVSPDLAEVITHYYIASAVQRHVLGLSMTEVKLSIDEINIDFFRKFTDDVDVVVKMEGLKGGQPWKDNRTIKLVRKGNSWMIDKIMTEKGRIDK
ncbi:hypothetical protein ACFOD0_08675 [Shewanella intestini]|uniref:DUF3828 domain-containing protein n=1 Tax=Shewanella intestini TaxID=2017544 RepID=A0ABS5HYT3_9GAMM|nr:MULTISPECIES: hypothetical protein [Shewanella]MBR9726952.1 hypothetical protein [Shewanella intestini]MRG34482.1 hypothetical protein [Shewanella sp. XMDDZSB0408]